MSKKNNTLKDLLIWIIQTFLIFLVFLGLFFLITKFVISNDQISGPSMQPTFENQDRIITYRHAKIKPGDIVVLKAPDEPGSLYIKRIIGMPGDTITAQDNKIYVNGKTLNQNFLKPGFKLTDNGYSGMYKTKYSDTNDFSISSLAKTSNYMQIYSKGQLQQMQQTNKVPQNSYFVMGDHRSVSKDSRYIGAIPGNKIVGVVKLRYWPLNNITAF